MDNNNQEFRIIDPDEALTIRGSGLFIWTISKSNNILMSHQLSSTNSPLSDCIVTPADEIIFVSQPNSSSLVDAWISLLKIKEINNEKMMEYCKTL
jgi:hypothetical protein